MIADWIECVNIERDVHTFIDEAFLRKHISVDDVSELNWMRIFNSTIKLSNSFILEYIKFIDWQWLTRPLDESFLNRYAYKIIQWNAQLYGRRLTFEFLCIHRNKFDWRLVSRSPPEWFNDLHYEEFGSMMDWSYLTKFSDRMDSRILLKYADDVDWDWITVNSIRSEPFARQFITLIDWNNPNLDTSNLSTEFLYKVLTVRYRNYSKNHKDKKIRIGASITIEFAVKHQDELDWLELAKKGLVTTKMRNIINPA